MEFSMTTKHTVNKDDKPTGASACIAIIDDDTGTRTMYAMYLSRQGYTLSTAADGKSGLELLRTKSFDAVLLDLHLPHLSGIDILREMKPSLRNMPVIVVSGTSDVSEAMDAIKLGAADFILKPVSDLSVLAHAVQKNIERYGLKRQARSYQRKLEDTLKQLKEGEIAAEKIQKRMLPPAEFERNGFSITGDLRAREYLSGDFYDYFSLDEDNLIFYLADISGHGVSSALITVLVKSFVNRLVDNYYRNGNETIVTPHKVLEQLNRELHTEQLEKFLTIFFGRIDIKQNKLSYANGGIFPPPIVANDNKTDFLKTKGQPVGLFPDAQFATEEFPLPEPFTLYLFSDGILDALGDGSVRKKMATIRDRAQLGLLPKIYDKLKMQEDRTDDMSLLIVERIVS